ncbi:hypothetical protein LP7551_03296 [Roseibium album]|nr:hypothetical protein LP7551_03296 [Roseibium album]
MFSNILSYPSLVASSRLSENEFCRTLLAERNFRFPSLEELICALQSEAGHVEDWLKYSEDRRMTPAFYLRKKGASFEVGYRSKSEIEKVGVYDDAGFACALFIKLKLEHRFLILSAHDER